MGQSKLTESEQDIHNALCDYLKLQYPHVIFTSESSGLHVPIGLAKRMKRQRSCQGLPDLFILHRNKVYNGLFLEIKKHESAVFNKNGFIKCNRHIMRQNLIIADLKAQGYFALFVFGFEHGKKVIDSYLKNN
jgi:hypothetical protein